MERQLVALLNMTFAARRDRNVGPRIYIEALQPQILRTIPGDNEI
jgi:hypothetical protein